MFIVPGQKLSKKGADLVQGPYVDVTSPSTGSS